MNHLSQNIIKSTIIGLASLSLGLIINPAQATTEHLTNSLSDWRSNNTIFLANQTNIAISNNQLNQGRDYFNGGQFAQAAQLWKNAARNYGASGDTVQQALSLNYLSLAYQQLSQWDEAKKAIDSSINLVESLPKAEASLWAKTFNTKARLLFYTGQTQTALETLEQAQQYYEQAEDEMGVMGSQINQAQALQALGFYRRSKNLLEGIIQQLEVTPDSLLKAGALRSLGINLQLIGDVTTSKELLEESLAIYQKLNATPQLASTLISLGNTTLDLDNTEAALNYFQQAELITTNPAEKLRAQLNQIQLHVGAQQWQSANSLAPQVYQQITASTPSRNSVYNAVNLAASFEKMGNQGKSLSQQELNQLLAQATQSANQLQDYQAQAYALQQWAKVYGKNGQITEAVKLTQQSLTIGQQINAEDLISQSAWQLGRLLKQQGKTPAAIASYTQAVKALQSLRGDLVSINPDVQFSFRSSVEPVYREFVALLLDDNPDQANLSQARQLIESLQLAELDNFFREACVDAQTAQIDDIDSQAAVIYPIILPDRLAVIVSTPGKPLSYHVTKISAREVSDTIDNFLGYLSPAFSQQDRLVYFQQVYDWLIKPAQQQQVLDNAETLVFVLDGKLRSIPMTTLHDGEQYLIEKYNIALSLGLQLLNSQDQNQQQLNLITGGLSESRQGFAALPAVKTEVDNIAQKTNSPVLLNEEFTRNGVTDFVGENTANIVHLATHGQFSSTAEETFLLTWDEKINVKELDQLLRSREFTRRGNIDLLVLSACQTAAGDDKATLGLAGFAIRSGARSTLGTLWTVRDESTALFMTKFYDYLKQPGVTKAQAVRQAQIDLINDPNFDEPLFWAPFVLIGNWL